MGSSCAACPDRVCLVLGKAREVRQFALPSGIAQAPFVLECGAEHRDMFAFAGVLGMQQEPATLALTPRVLWAVARVPERQLVVMPRR